MFNGHPVMVECRVFDGGAKEADTFGVTARNRAGEVVYHAGGDVVEGQIVIRHEEMD
jgi:hypothetical protein